MLLSKTLGSLSYFLGVEVIPNKHGPFLNQTKYINDILIRYKMFDSKRVPPPMAVYPSLSHEMGSILQNPTEYRALVGSLQ